ncbi:MAG: Fe-S oxidoreductase [Lysinibacillus sp.]
MPALTMDQVRQLNSYSIYTTEPKRTLFTLADIHQDFYHTDFLNLMMGITEAATETAAISHFSRRYGMFFAMQFHMLAAYDEIWDGNPIDIRFDVTKEFDTFTVSMFVNPNDWRYVDDDEREAVIEKILYKQGHLVIQQLRKVTTISPLILWENFFGYMLWHYHMLLSNPGLADQAFDDIDILENPKVWQRFSDKSWFAQYTGERSPSELVHIPVRKSCCFSKDITGLLACGFCPLK